MDRCLLGFDAELQDFYHDVVLGEADDPSAIRRALREVVHAYKRDTVEANASSILYDTPEKRAAYVLKHCACFGSAVARHFARLLRSNPSIAEALISRQRRVDVCCLGGGPGTEAVALAKAIGDLLRGGRTSRRLELGVRVLDASGDWRVTARSVTRALNESDRFFDRDTMQVSFGGLLECDLTGRWDEAAERAVSEADVVTMVYFVSAVNGSEARDRCDAMLTKVTSAVKPGCLIFFLDSAKDLHFEAVRSAARHLVPVHGPFLQDFHALSAASIQRFLELHFRRFRALLCLTDCFVSCAAWTRPRSDADAAPVPRCFGLPSSRKWKKRVQSNTRRQRMFREWLERWLRVQFLQSDFQVDDEVEDDGEPPEEWPSIPERTLYATKPKGRRIPPFSSHLR